MGFPHRLIDLGETAEQAAIRDVRDEISIRAESVASTSDGLYEMDGEIRNVD